MEEKKRKRRWGDRKEGRYLKSLEPYYSLQPFIFKTRNDACNLFSETVEVTEADRFLRRMRAEGYKGMSMLHLFTAAYVRAVSQCPGINRFISGQRIYARNNIEIVMTVKRELSSTAGESSIKVYCEPTDTIIDVYNKMQKEIDVIKNGDATDTDDAAGVLTKLPRFLLRFAMWVIERLDYHGHLPQSLLKASPFHGSMIVTDLGSVGIKPVFHHLYNFGNLPVFIAFGMKRHVNEVEKDGTVVTKKYIDYDVTVDERICDGYYFATAFKHVRSALTRPETLLIPPEKVVEDLER